MELRRIDDYRWELPRTGSMRVPGRIYSSDRLMAALQKDEAVQQVANVATLPGIVEASLAMPDIHWGYGFPIGGVAAFDWDTGVVSPGGVGYDINCGVRLLATHLEREAVELALVRAARVMTREGRIPFSTSRTAWRPDRRATRRRFAATAGTVGPPDRDVPSASERICMVLAVPMRGQAPGPGQTAASMARISASVVFSARTPPNTASSSWDMTMSRPRCLPASIGPPVTSREGMPSRAAAIKCPGMMLSHEESSTRPSNMCSMATISVEGQSRRG